MEPHAQSSGDDRPTLPLHNRTTWIVEEGKTTPVAALPVGTSLDDRYTILEVRGGRGRSGMGLVYIVEESGRFLAAKTLQPRFACRLDLIQRFIREAETWMLAGQHPNIVHAYKVELIDALPYLFMEFIPSDEHGRHTLSSHISAGPIPVERALGWARQLVHGMAHATAAVPGLVHRDLKPDNLLIDHEGTLKVTDFGLVRVGPEDEDIPSLSAALPDLSPGPPLTQAGSTFGTPLYMAPEQFETAGTVTAAADIYAAGCCLYEMISGRPPFRAERGGREEIVASLKHQHHHAQPQCLAEIVPTCSPDLSRIVLRCLAKAPEARWPDFASLQAALDGLKDAPQRALQPSPQSSPEDVAEQMQSLALLDGYRRVVSLKEVREQHANSPYDFHLALASYFHCIHDEAEEERQLRRAWHNARPPQGYEAVRRLALRYLDENDAEAADQLLSAYRRKRPDGIDHILIPTIRLNMARRQFAEAETHLEQLPDGILRQFLYVEILEARGDTDVRTRELRRLLDQILDRIVRKVDQIQVGLPTGWEYAGDAEILVQVLDSLRPELGYGALREVEQVVWPDLTGHPDFSADMAWLSEVLGSIADAPEMPEALRQTSRHAANVLEFPERLRTHLERDEYWFWSQLTNKEDAGS